MVLIPYKKSCAAGRARADAARIAADVHRAAPQTGPRGSAELARRPIRRVQEVLYEQSAGPRHPFAGDPLDDSQEGHVGGHESCHSDHLQTRRTALGSQHTGFQYSIQILK